MSPLKQAWRVGIGVLLQEVPLVEHEELYVPAVFACPEAANRGTRPWLVVGRIADGLSLATAQQRMDVVSKRLAEQYPAEDGGAKVRLQPVEEAFVEDFKALLIIVFGAVGFVLLIACANIANLLLVRGTARRREIAVRVAVGASRSRIFRQLFSESVLLTLLGAAARIVPAYGGIHLIPKLGAALPNMGLMRLNAPVLLFTLGLAFLTGVLFSLVPAFQFWDTETEQPPA